MILEINKIDIK